MSTLVRIPISYFLLWHASAWQRFNTGLILAEGEWICTSKIQRKAIKEWTINFEPPRNLAASLRCVCVRLWPFTVKNCLPKNTMFTQQENDNLSGAVNHAIVCSQQFKTLLSVFRWVVRAVSLPPIRHSCWRFIQHRATRYPLLGYIHCSVVSYSDACLFFPIESGCQVFQFDAGSYVISAGLAILYSIFESWSAEL